MAVISLEQLAAIVRDAGDFGHCLECGADVAFDEAIAGRVLCRACDAELDQLELERGDRQLELARRINAECAGWQHWSEARDVRPGQIELPLAA